jgi:hypothetical protein
VPSHELLETIGHAVEASAIRGIPAG